MKSIIKKNKINKETTNLYADEYLNIYTCKGKSPKITLTCIIKSHKGEPFCDSLDIFDEFTINEYINCGALLPIIIKNKRFIAYNCSIPRYKFHKIILKYMNDVGYFENNHIQQSQTLAIEALDEIINSIINPIFIEELDKLFAE